MPKILGNDLYFPPPHHGTPEGLLAVGGDLRPERLILAYSKGIFPWYSENTPILWWSPPKRCILPLDAGVQYHEQTHDDCSAQFHADLSDLPDLLDCPEAEESALEQKPHVGLRVSRRLARKYKTFTHTINKSFSEVIERCATVDRPRQDGTWITHEMQDAYIHLHETGFAHSVECWQDNKLVGGLYGVALGKAFFGESMFHLVPDASKMALMTLVDILKLHDFKLLDCQQATPHILFMGAEIISREHFTYLLKLALDAGGGGMSSLAHTSLRGKALSKKLPLLPI